VSSNHAQTTPETTSSSPTNEATRDPSLRIAATPAQYASPQVIVPSASNGSHHTTCTPA
jgi:hypothetical protein